MNENIDVTSQDLRLLVELRHISEKGNSVDDLKYDKRSRQWVYYENVKRRKTIK